MSVVLDDRIGVNNETFAGNFIHNELVIVFWYDKIIIISQSNGAGLLCINQVWYVFNNQWYKYYKHLKGESLWAT